MRSLSILLGFVALLSGGCAATLARTGRNLEGLNREQVHAALGEPQHSAVEGADLVEEFHTRIKVRDRVSAFTYTVFARSFYGLIEPMCFCSEVRTQIGRRLHGYDLRVVYGEDGLVTLAYPRELTPPPALADYLKSHEEVEFKNDHTPGEVIVGLFRNRPSPEVEATVRQAEGRMGFVELPPKTQRRPAEPLPERADSGHPGHPSQQSRVTSLR